MTTEITLMEFSNEFERIRSSHSTTQLALELLTEQFRFESVEEFSKWAVGHVQNVVEGSALGISKNQGGQWTILHASNSDHSPPSTVLNDALDADTILHRENWIVAPLVQKSQHAELFWMQNARNESMEPIDSMAAAMGMAFVRIRHRMRMQRRIRRLEAILAIAGQWNSNLEMSSLLQQMAETSTQLLNAERASIFLWDRTNKILVGRPALGVEENELRIPDDAGIVGQVVHTGEVRRVDVQEGDAEINRDVDKKLGFVTKTLLCVPLRGRHDKILGAFEMINKKGGNFTTEDEVGLVELASHAAIALENTQQVKQLLESRKQIAQQAAEGIQLIGETTQIRNLRSTVEKVAKTDLSLLVLGENGTGKEVVSRMVHYLSGRRDEPFIAVNCAALTESLLESELFGHEKGAFTDAHEARAGKFELASGGTLFLDEIGDLSPGGQAKLLRVLEERVVVRVGGSIPIPVDTRVIAATNQKLAEMVGERRFREDLFFRLNVITIDIPPLRDRIDDIQVLAEHFLADFCAKARRETPRFTMEAVKRLRQHLWPGNVRELRNLMERLAYLSQSETIGADDLAFIMAPKKEAMSSVSLELSLPDATKSFQVEYIRKQIERCGGNMSEAAKHLGLHRSNLYRKMRQLNMSDAEEDHLS